jgi:hypothetical protein
MQLAALRSILLTLTAFLTTVGAAGQGDVFNSGSPGTNKCQEARQSEKRRHDLARVEIVKERIEANSQREQEMIGCGGDQRCIDRVAGAHGARERQLQIKDEREIARHNKAIADIDAGPCSGGTPATSHPNTVPSDANNQPLPPTRRTGAGSQPGTQQGNMGTRSRNPANLAEINCPDCKCTDLKASQLQVDQLVKDLPAGTYNCFGYAKTFIEGRLHILEPAEKVHSEAWADPNYLYGKNYDLTAFGASMKGFKAQIGDLVVVEGDNFPLGYRPWVHIGVVTYVDGNGAILSIRQKPDPSHCVVDLTPTQFYKVYPVAGNYRYMLYRSRFKPGVLPRAR